MEELAVGTRVSHPRYGEGIISRVHFNLYEIFFENGGKVELTKYNEDLSVEQEVEKNYDDGLTLAEIEKTITFLLDHYQGLHHIVPLGDKWKGGTIELKPGKEGLSSKEIPIETFFHKIVMLRDRLRVLEQNINSHSKLDDEDKVHLQQYISRAYGSLTSFNILFDEKENHFKSKK